MGRCKSLITITEETMEAKNINVIEENLFFNKSSKTIRKQWNKFIKKYQFVPHEHPNGGTYIGYVAKIEENTDHNIKYNVYLQFKYQGNKKETPIINVTVTDVKKNVVVDGINNQKVTINLKWEISRWAKEINKILARVGIHLTETNNGTVKSHAAYDKAAYEREQASKRSSSSGRRQSRGVSEKKFTPENSNSFDDIKIVIKHRIIDMDDLVRDEKQHVWKSFITAWNKLSKEQRRKLIQLDMEFYEEF
jgi:hypothetical protein